MLEIALGLPRLAFLEQLRHVGHHLEQHDDLVEVIEIVGGKSGARIDIGRAQ